MDQRARPLMGYLGYLSLEVATRPEESGDGFNVDLFSGSFPCRFILRLPRLSGSSSLFIVIFRSVTHLFSVFS